MSTNEESTSKKGKPTPKRKEAEAKRTSNSLAPATTRAAKNQDRAAMREKRLAARAAYMRGEESALPLRDKGPVRRFVRDYVDSRRSLGEYFLPLIMVVLVLTVIPNKGVQLLAILFMYAAMLYSILSGVVFTRKIKKLVNEKFPGESTKGLGMYGWLRSTQMRKMRAPAPTVSREGKKSK
jgi:hypothetical protein